MKEKITPTNTACLVKHRPLQRDNRISGASVYDVSTHPDADISLARFKKCRAVAEKVFGDSFLDMLDERCKCTSGGRLVLHLKSGVPRKQKDEYEECIERHIAKRKQKKGKGKKK